MKRSTPIHLSAIETLEPRQLMAGQRLFFENFENGTHGWTQDTEYSFDQRDAWKITAGFAHSGTHAVQTALAGRDAILTSPAINLPQVSQYADRLFVRWWEYSDYKSKGGYGASMPVIREWLEDAEQWGPWNVIDIDSTSTPQKTNAWGYSGLDATMYGGKRVQLGFHHVGSTNGARGWMVDDVEVVREKIHRPWQADNNFENGWNGWWSTRGVWDIGRTSVVSAPDGGKIIGTGMQTAPVAGETSQLISPAFYMAANPDQKSISLQFKSYSDKPFSTLFSVELQHWIPSYGWMPVNFLTPNGVDIAINTYQPAGKWKQFTLTAGFPNSTVLPHRIVFNATFGENAGRGFFLDDVKLNYPGKTQQPTTTPTPVMKPEIRVSNPFGELTDGVTRVMWGSHRPGSGSKDITFTVRNSGTGTLNISKLVLDNSIGFTIVKQPLAIIAAGGMTTFTIRMSTTTAGTKGALVRLLSNDADEATFNFNISGLVKA